MSEMVDRTDHNCLALVSGIPLRPGDMQNAEPHQYSYDDLRPYIPSPEQEARYIQGLSSHRMFPEAPLDERFADFKVRLAAAKKRHRNSDNGTISIS